jgi:hypothetical protein
MEEPQRPKRLYIRFAGLCAVCYATNRKALGKGAQPESEQALFVLLGGSSGWVLEARYTQNYTTLRNNNDNNNNNDNDNDNDNDNNNNNNNNNSPLTIP